jgi:hypothetical protein
MEKQILFQRTATAEYAAVLAKLLREERTHRYTYMDIQQFAELSDVRERSRIYWYEIIERAHCASILALLRTERWLSAAVFGAEHKNFLAFAAAFRGLLESAADTRYALGEVPNVLASTFRLAQTAMRGQLSAIVVAPKLEEDLIHFSHGRKLARSEQAPDSHTAKTMQEYLNALERGPSGPMHDAYAELCNITHPAADSVLYLLERGPDGSIAFCSTADEEAIVELCERGGTVFAYALSESLMYPVTILKIINRFQIPELQVPEADSTAVVESSLWDEINEILRGRKRE